MTQRFTDRASIEGTRRTGEGYMITEAFAVRTGIQLYTGDEVGLKGTPVVRIYRAEDEVRSPASLASFSHAPITRGHPAEMVTADNWAQLAKGEASTEATWDGNRIKIPLIFKDTDMIRAIEGGERELSAGYTCQLDMTPGVTPDGENYDGRQTNIRVNHIAVVPKGRAGNCRIGDADHWGAIPITNDSQGDRKMTLRTILVDGLSVETTDAGVAAIEKLTGIITSKDAEIASASTAHNAAIVAKDEAIGALKVELASAKDAAITPAKLTQFVADRVALESVIHAIDTNIVTANVADADLRKAAVVAVHGADMVKDADEAEIRGMFKAIAKTKTADAEKAGDTFANNVSNGTPVPIGDARAKGVSAYDAMKKSLQDAHLGTPAA